MMDMFSKNQIQLKLLLIVLCFIITVSSHPADKDKGKEKSSKHAKIQRYQSDPKKDEKLQGSESMYHSLPMPFVHYPFPFVNSYTPRYFPYGYAGLGHAYAAGFGGLGYGYAGSGYGLGYGHYI